MRSGSEGNGLPRASLPVSAQPAYQPIQDRNRATDPMEMANQRQRGRLRDDTEG